MNDEEQTRAWEASQLDIARAIVNQPPVPQARDLWRENDGWFEGPDDIKFAIYDAIDDRWRREARRAAKYLNKRMPAPEPSVYEEALCRIANGEPGPATIAIQALLTRGVKPRITRPDPLHPGQELHWPPEGQQ